MISNSLDDIILFANDDDEPYTPEEPADVTRCWHVLIVDDDAEIHSVTQLALSGLTALGKDLYFGHAFSGEESIKYVKEHADVAIILMDVVMENENAGLNAVKRIRDELHQYDVRIILRTGQPGYAPEEQVVKDYDINDYKTKTELTRSKLVTTLVSALRSYQQICQIKQNQSYLEQIITASAAIQQQQKPNAFGCMVIEKLCQLLSINANGLLCVITKYQATDSRPIVIAGIADYSELTGSTLESLDNGRIINQLSQSFKQEKHQLSPKDTVFYIPGQKYSAALYLDEPCQPDEQTMRYIDVFLSNIAVGLDNVNLIQALKTTAYKDKLTGLSNRTDFIRLLDEYRENEGMGDMVALIDIARFSDINNGLGQEIGNLMLKACTERLTEKYSSSCYLARVNADVFGIIGHSIMVSPEQIKELFSFPLRIGEQRIPVYFNMGFYKRSNTDKNGIQILRRADIALNQAKKDKLLKYAYFEEVDEHKMEWRLGMVHQLRADFEAQRLQVWFQPQLDLTSHRIIGFEALLRWQTQDGVMVSPDIFVPIAEHSGLIIEIGIWVIEQSCRQLKQLEERGLKNVSVSINVSIAQFREPQFVLNTIDTIKSMAVEPHLIELEITESILISNPKTVIQALTLLKAEGIKITLDDFGTSFSSLNYLHQLPLDRIKIDKAFIRDMQNKNGAIILETILTLGQRLGLHTIAEGVEDTVQEVRLNELGCEAVQGFLYAKPLPPSQLKNYVDTNRVN